MRTPQSMTYTVEGPVGAFPVDMLRHDAAWPCTQEDVQKITDSLSAEVRHEWRKAGTRRLLVHVQSYTDPTVGRWESFGWRVKL